MTDQSLSVRQQASGFSGWLPAVIDRRIRLFAWLSFLAEIIIVGTGGAVRLTGSGLGCPTWPSCTPDSLIPTSEMGIHGIIEFGNRMMSGVVGIIAIIVLVLLWRIRRERRDLFTLALVVLFGVVAQGIVGGITVLTGLNPFIVGFHYVASLALVCVAAAFLVRMYSPTGIRSRVVPAWFVGIAHATSFVIAVTIAVGVLTTASGPHSGDAAVGRTGFNVELLEHLHAWPAYLAFGLTIVLVVAAVRLRTPILRWTIAVLAVEIVQIAVGLYQARNGLPELAVGVHMILACLLAAAMTVVILSLKTVRPIYPDGLPAALPISASARDE